MTKLQPARTVALPALAAVIFLPSLGLAQGFYAGVDTGRGHAALSCMPHADCNRSAGAAGIRLGYQWTPVWGVEIGFLGMGSTSGTPDRGLGPERGQIRIGTALYQGTATWAHGPWSLTAKLGLADNIARSTFGDYPASDRSSITAAGGVEIAYRLAPHWRISLGDEFRPNVALTGRSRANVNVVVAGLTYGFAQ